MAAAFAAPEASFSWSIAVGTNLSARTPLTGDALTLHVRGCDLRAWVDSRVPAMRRCFAELGHVAFAGDALTRFSFISLTQFLHTGLWQPSHGPPGDTPRAWPDVEEGSYLTYFRDGAARLGDAEVCDCYVGSAHVENRYYGEGLVQTSYVSLFSPDTPLALHAPSWTNASCGSERGGVPCAQAGCRAGACMPHADPHYREVPWPASYTALPRLLAADVLVLNTGLHAPGRMAEERAMLAGLARGMAAGAGGGGDLRLAWAKHFSEPLPPQQRTPAEAPRTRARGGGSFVWRTTTPRRDADSVAAAARALPQRSRLGPAPAAPPAPWPRVEADIAATVAGAGGRVFDAAAIVWPLAVQLAAEGSLRGTSWPSDAFSLAPAVSANLNRALLAFLCGE